MRWALIGAVIGLVILGAGGRVAMYFIARSNGAPGAWTLGGTITVVLMGGLSGVVGGVLHLIARWMTGNRASLRRILYIVVMLLITWRGVSPPSLVSVALFFPLVLCFILAIEAAWSRLGSRSAIG